MTLKYRITIFAVLWLVAGFVSSIFADTSFTDEDAELFARASMVYLAPLCLAHGLAFVIVPGGYSAWQGREFWEHIVYFTILAAFATHAIIALSRKTRRQFILCSAIQLVFLAVSVASYLYYWHWDAIHMHG